MKCFRNIFWKSLLLVCKFGELRLHFGGELNQMILLKHSYLTYSSNFQKVGSFACAFQLSKDCNNVPRGVKNKDNIFTERVSEANEWVKILSLFWTPSGTLTLFHRLGGVCNTRENINIFTAHYIARKNIDIFTGHVTGRKNKGKYFYATSLNSTP